jgi:hypothetical protein
VTEQPSPRTRARFLAPFVTLTCAYCGSLFHRRRSKRRRLSTSPTCSRRCYRQAHATQRVAGLGTVMIRQGRAFVHVGTDAPGADAKGYIPRARLVAARELGRPLAANERVVHLDGDKLNDAPENLAVQVIVLGLPPDA